MGGGEDVLVHQRKHAASVLVGRHGAQREQRHMCQQGALSRRVGQGVAQELQHALQPDQLLQRGTLPSHNSTALPLSWSPSLRHPPRTAVPPMKRNKLSGEGSTGREGGRMP